MTLELVLDKGTPKENSLAALGMAPRMPEHAGFQAGFDTKIEKRAGVGLSAVNRGSDNQTGLYLALFVNIAKDLNGVNVTPGINHAYQDQNGISLAGLTNLAERDSYGVRIGLTNKARKSYVDIGAVNISDEANWLHIAGVIDMAKEKTSGVRIAPICTTKRMSGVDIGAICIATEEAAGVQAGLVANYAKDISGVQVGAVNVAGTLYGYQVGGLCYASSGDSVSQVGLLTVRGPGVTGSFLKTLLPGIGWSPIVGWKRL